MQKPPVNAEKRVLRIDQSSGRRIGLYRVVCTRYEKMLLLLVSLNREFSGGFEISFIGFLTFCDFHAKLLLIDT